MKANLKCTHIDGGCQLTKVLVKDILHHMHSLCNIVLTYFITTKGAIATSATMPWHWLNF